MDDPVAEPIAPGRPIAEYAFLSDCQGAALVAADGTVDWLCLPRFDAPSVFAGLLDTAAGTWRVCPAGEFASSRRYVRGTLVLETTFRTPTGRAVLTDALLLGDGEEGHEIGLGSPHVLARRLEVVEGALDVEVDVVLRPGYGLEVPRLVAADGGVLVQAPTTELALAGPPGAELAGLAGQGVRWRLHLGAGQSAEFALQCGADRQPAAWPAPEIGRRIDDTVRAWRSWTELHQRYEGPWQELVHLSGRVLQGLTYAPTGAVVAAPTTSLPEAVGEERNWDYRYAWLRDAALTLKAQWVAACPDEAERFVGWMVRSAGGHTRVGPGGLQVMYGVEGETDLPERELPHLAGWRASRPVRVGNAAASQKQVDVVGELLDAAHQLQDTLGTLKPETADFVAGVADEAAGRWTERDSSIWEIRGEQRHYLYSKLMCWVALDRALLLAPQLGVAADDERQARWRREHEAVRAAIVEQGWNEDVGAYTQSFGSSALDASALMLLLTGLFPPDDPRMVATVEAVARELSDGSGLVYRYRGPDGLGGEETPFVLCSYWLVEAFALLGRRERAVELFERVTAYANDLGLLAEEADPASGELRGNFPQAFSHVGLVNAAWAIHQATDGPAGAAAGTR